MSRQPFFSSCLILVVLLSLPFKPLLASEEPNEMVSQTLEELQTALQGKSESSDYEQVVYDVLLDKVDLDFILKYVMGKEYYLSASEGQIKAFKEVFKNRLIKTYSSSLEIFKDANMEVLPHSKLYAGDRLAGVSMLMKSDGGVYPMRFTLRKNDEGQWKIVNLVLNGINVAKIFNGQFVDEMNRANKDLDIVTANWDLGNKPRALEKTGSDSYLKNWQEIVFKGKTEYKQGSECIEARSNGSASGLIREKRVKISDKTKLTWSWRADALIQNRGKAKEKSEDGDDFIARVFVIKEGKLPWQTKALNYVWSRENKVGDSWINPIVKNARMVVVQSGESELGQWHSFERNIQKDFKKYFGIDIDSIDGIALMTDTDNTGGIAEACYVLPEIIKPENLTELDQL